MLFGREVQRGFKPNARVDIIEKMGDSLLVVKRGRERVKISVLWGALLLLDFEDGFDVERVLIRGLKWFKEKVLHLEMWTLEVGCFHNRVC